MAHSNDVRERILDSAAKLFMTRGFAATSVRMIGDAAGVGQSSLYHHVGSKGQILADLHESFVASLLERLQAVEAMDGSVVAQIEAIIRVVIDTVQSHQARVTIFLREGHALPKNLQKTIIQSRDEVDAILDRILARGIQTGVVRADVDPRLIRLGIYGMCNWSYQWFRRSGEHTAEEIAQAFATMVLSGITLP